MSSELFLLVSKFILVLLWSLSGLYRWFSCMMLVHFVLIDLFISFDWRPYFKVVWTDVIPPLLFFYVKTAILPEKVHPPLSQQPQSNWGPVKPLPFRKFGRRFIPPSRKKERECKLCAFRSRIIWQGLNYWDAFPLRELYQKFILFNFCLCYLYYDLFLKYGFLCYLDCLC